MEETRPGLENTELRKLVRWHKEYRQEWDTLPEEYLGSGVVPWGRSRRLGLFTLGHVKAYIGVQHVDPGKPDWEIVDEPRARFFLSLFVSARVVTLRTFPTIGDALDTLLSFLIAARS